MDATPITAGQQFAAIAQLRWALFRNGFRRKGGAGELAARIIVFPLAAIFVIGPTVGATFAAYGAASDNSLQLLAPIFWGITVLQVLVSINISAPGLSFDPESLIRFPLSFPRYLIVRLFLGLLSVSTIVGTCALLGAAAGASFAIPSLAPAAFGAAFALALCNMLLIRMIFAWVDRWLSTRRARELFTVLIFVFSIGFQYANATFNGLGGHASSARQQAKIDAFLRFYHAIEPALHRLPPGLTGLAILHSSQGGTLSALILIAGILLFAAFFLSVFAWRMQREYRGENLSEAAAPSPSPKPSAKLTPATPVAIRPAARESSFALPAVVAANLEKEWIYVRRNPTQFAGLVMPLAMVFIFAGRMNHLAAGGFLFPTAAAYALLTSAVMAYNILGLDASGVQFYFIAPISIRSVILAKNLFGFAITAVQVLLVYLVLNFISGPPSPIMAISTVCWVVFATLVNVTIGNMRSITAPKKVDPSKMSRKQTSQLSALMCLGLVAALAVVGAGVVLLSRTLNLFWLPIPILLALAAGAYGLYIAGLNNIDTMALNRREILIEELSKAS